MRDPRYARIMFEIEKHIHEFDRRTQDSEGATGLESGQRLKAMPCPTKVPSTPVPAPSFRTQACQSRSRPYTVLVNISDQWTTG